MNPWKDKQVTNIYALCDGDGTVRYVGKTIYPLSERMKSHLRVARKKPVLPVARWLSKREKDGIKISINLIETVKKGWEERERYWINYYRNESVSPLLNLTDGGEGFAGHKFSDSHKQKISAALKTGAIFSCEVCDKQFWRKKKEIVLGNCRFCSKICYGVWQKGKHKPIPLLMKKRGIAAAALARRSQTHCKRGHQLSGENLFITSIGGRGCKECRKIHKRTYRARNS